MTDASGKWAEQEGCDASGEGAFRSWRGTWVVHDPVAGTTEKRWCTLFRNDPIKAVLDAVEEAEAFNARAGM